MYKTRTATKAIIIKDGKILLTENLIDGELIYVTPGGGLDHNESLEEGMKRECMEEAGASVKVNDILFVRDYIADRHKTRARKGFHQVEVYFQCDLLSDVNLALAHGMDDYQIGLKWADIEEFKTLNYHPVDLKPSILEIMSGKSTKIYVGDIV